MANHKSAAKRARQSVTRHRRHSINKTKVRHAVKNAVASVGRPAEESAKALRQAMSTLYKAASKGTIHPKNAARRVSRLAQKIHRGQPASE
ncbi:MAG: 30S ribosomal protein S20 [Deltaproteobacteria bacterium]|nr:30S ribosomal protein S20 [Deltaproteobacteria bacterium]